MVWKYRECLPDVPLARDIPKIGKFKATNSLRVSCLLEFARHGHNLMGVSPHRSLISASVQPTAMVSVVIRHLKEVLGKALLTYRNLILRHMSVGKSAKQDKAL